MSFRNAAINADTEQKKQWCKMGEKMEEDFIGLIDSFHPNWRVKINPEKNTKKTAPDMVYGDEDKYCDLKCQRTHFFTAGRDGLDPQYTFTFNQKDYVRYKELYPEIGIFVWINWEQTSLTIRGTELKVDPYSSVYAVPFQKIVDLIESGQAPLHSYGRRVTTIDSNHPLSGLVDKDGNAKASYLIDMRLFKPILVA